MECQKNNRLRKLKSSEVNLNYKYNEDITLEELREYIDSTYDAHYSKDKFQATEFIIDGGHGEGFCIGTLQRLIKIL